MGSLYLTHRHTSHQTNHLRKNKNEEDGSLTLHVYAGSATITQLILVVQHILVGQGADLNPFFLTRIQQTVDKDLQAKGWKLMPTAVRSRYSPSTLFMTATGADHV